MKRYQPLILVLLILFALTRSIAQDRIENPPRVPYVGAPIRIDFEGTHELPAVMGGPVDRGGPPVAGPPQRVDFEGTHEFSSSSAAQAKGPPAGKGAPIVGSQVRIDFEGTHPPK